MSIKSILIFLLFVSFQSLAVDEDIYIVSQKTKGSFPMAEKGKTSSILMDKTNFAGAIRAGKSLQADIQKVTSVEPVFSTDNITHNKQIIIIGTLGKNQWIDQLVKDKNLIISDLQGK